MSAIVGMYFLDGRPVNRADLERMVTILAHRGPDGAGIWNEGPVGLGHRMLWTTPESLQEKLPLVNQTGDLVLTADARIDNRDELIAALGLTDRSPAEIADSQLILAAYEKWGEHCPEKLLGDFAFAIWDGRKQVLFCARDHFGVKPFYYYQSGRLFAFASEIKALLCLPEVPRQLNEVRVAYHLWPELLFQDKAITFYRDIYRLLPAHSVTIIHEETRLCTYWSLDPERELRLGSDDEYAEAFREVFTESVRCRLRSAYPVGSTLSGGLDSSSIACVARGLLTQNGNYPLHTFSAVFEEVPSADESSFIKAVVAQGNVEAHFTHPDRLSPLVDLNRVFWHLDEAFYGTNYFMPWGLYQTAAEQGVRVLMDGTDGDTTVSHGMDYLDELVRTGQWEIFAAEAEAITKRFDSARYATQLGILRAHGLKHLSELAGRGRWAAFAKGVSQISKYFGVPRRNLLLSHGLKPLIPEPMRRTWRVLRRRNGSAPRVHPIANDEFARRVALEKRIQSLEHARSNFPHTARANHLYYLDSGALPYSLELMDRLAAAFSIELRYPFCDNRMVEFCLALPPEQKLQEGWSRVVMRRAMTNILPAEVQWRGGKASLAQVYNQGLRLFEQDLLDQTILQEGGDIEEYVDVAALREAYHRWLSQGNDDDLQWIWQVVTLILWLRQTGLRP